MLKKMLPHSIKKRSQIEAAIGYLENRITGNEFLGAMNQAVRLRKRSSDIRTEDFPFSKIEGSFEARRIGNLEKKRALKNDQLGALKRDRESGMSFGVLAIKYGISLSTAYNSATKYS